jgi:hypothetical protein
MCSNAGGWSRAVLLTGGKSSCAMAGSRDDRKVVLCSAMLLTE